MSAAALFTFNSCTEQIQLLFKDFQITVTIFSCNAITVREIDGVHMVGGGESGEYGDQRLRRFHNLNALVLVEHESFGVLPAVMMLPQMLLKTNLILVPFA